MLCSEEYIFVAIVPLFILFSCVILSPVCVWSSAIAVSATKFLRTTSNSQKRVQPKSFDTRVQIEWMDSCHHLVMWKPKLNTSIKPTLALMWQHAISILSETFLSAVMRMLSIISLGAAVLWQTDSLTVRVDREDCVVCFIVAAKVHW